MLENQILLKKSETELNLLSRRSVTPTVPIKELTNKENKDKKISLSLTNSLNNPNIEKRNPKSKRVKVKKEKNILLKEEEQSEKHCE